MLPVLEAGGGQISIVAKLRDEDDLICKICFAGESVAADRVIQHSCVNHQTGKHFKAYVCKRCLDAGRLAGCVPVCGPPPRYGERQRLAREHG